MFDPRHDPEWITGIEHVDPPAAPVGVGTETHRLARFMGRRIDYIFVRGPDKLMRGEPSNVKLAFTESVPGREGPVWASDHYGVVCDLSMTKASPGA